MPKSITPLPRTVPVLLQAMDELRDNIIKLRVDLLRSWHSSIKRPGYASSAQNLADYIGLRRYDIRILQTELAALGLSSLGRCESHVLPSLDAVRNALRLMAGKRVAQKNFKELSEAIEIGTKELARNTDQFFGPAPKNRSTRIMVTLPSDAALDYTLVRELLNHGMNCARINCAHDCPSAWEKMVLHIRNAERETGRRCRILMDLAGPKLRTGSLKPAPPVLHIKVRRDEQGASTERTRVVLDASGRPGCSSAAVGLAARPYARLSVESAWLNRLQPGEEISFRDLRNRPRRFLVDERLSETECVVSTDQSAFVGPGTALALLDEGRAHHKQHKTITGDFVSPPREIRVFKGDSILLSREQEPDEAKPLDDSANGARIAYIGCTEPAVFDALKPGQPVWIDDGRVGAMVETVDERGALLRVNHARASGEKIGSDKGLNFPDTELALPALTDKDLHDLDFAASHADIIGLSFVKCAADVDRLSREMERRGAKGLGIVAKIETLQAVRNLPEIIIHGAGRHRFAIMIARGDLAVEIGYERLAEIQEEVLWVCEAGRVPVIWATQVLEELVKTDKPSRAEMTDAAMSQRAECVMLNKGPYVLHALAALDSVIERMQAHQHKKTAQFRALHW